MSEPTFNARTGEEYALFTRLLQFDPTKSFEGRVEHLLNICRSYLHLSITYIPDIDVRRCFSNEDENRYHALRADPSSSELEQGDKVYVLLRNNGDRNLGALCLPKASRALNNSETRSQLLGQLSAAAGRILSDGKYIDELRQEAETDGLTRLLTRKKFDVVLAQELALAQHYHAPLALLLADIDHFKQVNDTHGHLAGDHVLQQVSRALKSSVRPQDYAARYGGEELALILPDTPLEGAIVVGERVQTSIAALSILSTPVTLSIGIGVFPQHAQDLKSIITAADKALYTAKKKGRNCVVVYAP